MPPGLAATHCQSMGWVFLVSAVLSDYAIYFPSHTRFLVQVGCGWGCPAVSPGSAFGREGFI